MNEKVLEARDSGIRKKIVSFIPDDGKCIQFKELLAKCNENGISYRQLRQELKYLTEAGTVKKEAMKAKRGAGTCYRRTVLVPIDRCISPSSTVLNLKDVMEDMVERNPNKNEAEKWAAWGFCHAYATICQAILNELELSLSYPDPEERFDSALNDFIAPLIKRLVPFYRHPAINNERAKSALFEAIMLGYKEWDTVWK